MNNNPPSPNSHNIFKIGIENYQANKYKEIEKYYLSETIKLSLLTGPLYCISANMQFLFKTKNNSSITSDNSISFFKKNIHSTSSFAFKPNFFSNYKECIFSLRRQGILAFYKGNFYRLLFFSTTNQLKKHLDSSVSKYAKNKRLKDIMLYSLVDIFLNPLLFIEARYSIQNRRKGFKIYSNLFDLLNKSWREIYSG